MLVNLASDLSLCLRSAHGLELLHRDVKPANVLQMIGRGMRPVYSLCELRLSTQWVMTYRKFSADGKTPAYAMMHLNRFS